MISTRVATGTAGIPLVRSHGIRWGVQCLRVAVAVGLGFVLAAPIRAQSAPTAAGPLPSFEVASIKPDRSGSPGMRIMTGPERFNAEGVTLRQLISMAYGVKDFQLSGGPSWINSERYDIQAKAEDSFVEKLKTLPPDQAMQQLGLLLQSLLADRCKLQVSHETKDLPVYALVVAKNGPKLQPSKAADAYPNAMKGPDGKVHAGMMRMGRGELTGQVMPMSELARLLSHRLGRDVIDKTGLKGNYDFTLTWTPDQGPSGMMQGPPNGAPPNDNAPPPDTAGPSIFTALQDQLGLKLEPQKGPVDIIVIAHIERPSED
jgi:uncharacterized protein (TIGR03435 family)